MPSSADAVLYGYLDSPDRSLLPTAAADEGDVILLGRCRIERGRFDIDGIGHDPSKAQRVAGSERGTRHRYEQRAVVR